MTLPSSFPSSTSQTLDPAPPPHHTTTPRPIILALSGPSSSGKTTLATVLAALLPQCHLLHLDDFYLPERQLPLRAGVPDWDSAASFDLDALQICCERWKSGDGVDLVRSGSEVGNGVGEVDGGKQGIEGGGGGVELKDTWTGDGVHGGTMPAKGTPAREHLEKVMTRLKYSSSSPLAISDSSDGLSPRLSSPPPPPPPLLQNLTTTPRPRLLILDGILLHTPAFAALQPLFDIKILLRASFAEAQRRREARGGYVTLEGFWEDPPGYFEDVVWRSYEEGHAGFFRDGDVEGEVLWTEEVGEGEGQGEGKGKERGGMVNDIWIQPLGMDLAQGLEWVWEVLEREMGGGARGERGAGKGE